MAYEGEERSSIVTIMLVVTCVFSFVFGIAVFAYYGKTRNMVERPKKKIGAKKMKRNLLKHGMTPVGE